MKKRLNTDELQKEFQQGSAFFRKNQETPTSAPEIEPSESRALSQATKANSFSDTTTPRYHDTTPDTTVSPASDDSLDTQASLPMVSPLLERTRRAVKHLGKEAATHRFTVEEKKVLKKIEHEYALKGIRTSENEITRIAINYVTEEYRQNKENSVLAQILDLLNN